MFSRCILLFCFCISSFYLIAQPDRVREGGRRATETPSEDGPRSSAKTSAPSPTSEFAVSGKMVDATTGEPLAGAYVKVKDQMLGTMTNPNGEFSLRLVANDSVALEFSYVGFGTETRRVFRDTPPLTVALNSDALAVDEIVIASSRVPERYLETPVSIETLNLTAVNASASLNVYETIGNVKPVDVLTPSLTLKVFNTRGFNNRTNFSVVSRLDGQDLQAPGLNFPIGMLNGSPDVDIARVEILPGGASALYGPGAINGMLLTTSKDPFVYQGLSASYKIGVNHLGAGSGRAPAPLHDFQFRYAKAFNDKFAFKLVGQAFEATDWVADARTDDAGPGFNNTYAGSTNTSFFEPGPANPGYDGTNTYGDEVAQLFTAENTAEAFGFALFDSTEAWLVARDGYADKNIVEPSTRVFSGSAALHYRINKRLEASLTSRVGNGKTVYQNVSRYQIDDFLYHTHKLEFKGPRWFARAYASFEDAGNTFDARLAAIGVNNGWKPDDAWFGQYLFAYSDEELLPGTGITTNALLNNYLAAQGRAPVTAGDHAAARAFANTDNRALIQELVNDPLFGLLYPDPTERQAFAETILGGEARPEAGSERFNELLDSVRQVNLTDGGALFQDNTWFYHAEAQYDFSDHIPYFDLIVGGSFRQFLLNSGGTLFVDTTGNENLSVWEWGAYAQVIRSFFDDRLKLTGSLRVDQSQPIRPVLSPRLAAVVGLDRNRKHYLRASYQNAFRNPTLQAYYVNTDIAIFTFTGGVSSIDRYYNLELDGEPNAYTEASVQAFLESGDSSQLERASLKPVEPERMRTGELGYRARLGKRVGLDAAYWFNRYTNRENTFPVVGPDAANPGEQGAVLTQADIAAGRYRTFRRYSNAEDVFYAHGLGVSVDVALPKNLLFYINGTYQDLLAINGEPDRVVAAFNSPRLKFNVGLQGNNLWKGLGFGLNYRWREQYDYSDGAVAVTIPSISTLDAQVNYRVPKIKTEFRVGGTNLTNNYYRELYGGPRIGGLYYFQIRFDQFLN